MKTTRSVVLPEYNDNLLRAMIGLKIEERPLPELLDNEVLIRMEGSPCNPSDIAFLRGGYNIIKPLPAVPGFEGTGTVIETGRQATSLTGKQVSCFVQEDSDGTWAEYFIAQSKDCIVLKEGIDMEQAACLSINPLTAYALFEMAKQAGCRTFIQNAAGGQVPQFLNVLAEKNGIKVINLVRKATLLKQMKQKGLKHVLDTSDECFFENLRDLCQQLKPGIAFDAVGGEMTGQMMKTMPAGAQVILYGALSGEKLSAMDPMSIIFQKKLLRGFNLNDWLAMAGREKFVAITNEIQDMIIRGELETGIQGIFKLDDVVRGMRTYIKSMSAGKVIFTP